MDRLKKMTLAVVAAAALAAPAATAASAEDQLYVPLFVYRTGPFAGSGTPSADGLNDYLALLNERDGGVGGVKINFEECETGYNTQKGLECYETVKVKNPVMLNPWSTGTTIPLIPRAPIDKIPILSMAYGLSASAQGDVFPWIFNPPDTYWDGLSQIIRYIGSQEGGLDKLKGKKIGYIYLDVGYGKEPLPLLEQLSKDYGFETKLYPVAASEMQNQSGQWLNVRRDRPDYMIMWGWGAMIPTAFKEAVKIDFPMDKFISNWWPTEEDARSAGDGAKGLKTLNWHAASGNFPFLDDIQKYVISKGKSQTTKEWFNTSLYNHGIYNSVLIAEAIRTAQKLSGKKLVNGEDVRRGLEALNIDAARWKEMGMENFAGPIRLTCSDHNGHRPTFVQQWDGTKYVKVSDWIQPLADKVMPLLESDAKAYVQKNAPPARTEHCDVRS